jgi:hypothetical protein
MIQLTCIGLWGRPITSAGNPPSGRIAVAVARVRQNGRIRLEGSYVMLLKKGLGDRNFRPLRLSRILASRAGIDTIFAVSRGRIFRRAAVCGEIVKAGAAQLGLDWQSRCDGRRCCTMRRSALPCLTSLNIELLCAPALEQE